MKTRPVTCQRAPGPRPDTAQLGLRLAGALQRREQALCETAEAERGFQPEDVRGELCSAVSFLERSLPEVREQLAARRSICSREQWAALMLPANATAGGAVHVGVLLTVGNRVLVRMSSRSPRMASVLQDAFDEAAPGAVAIEHSTSGPAFMERIVSDPSVGFAMVFGGERVGDELLLRARDGALDKRIVYNGPGKDPAIVLDGAPVGAVADVLTAAKFARSGQTCVAPENILVHRALHDPLVARLVAACERRADIAPMLSPRVPRIVREQLDDAQRRGARIVYGGRVDGLWVQPTVVTGVTPEMALFQDETFAPVFAVAEVADAAEAVELAGAGRFGLTCTVFGAGADAVAAGLVGEPYARPVDDLLFGAYGHVSVNRPVGRLHLEGAFGGYGKSGWIADHEGLRQGPSWLAREATRGA
jgi:acyl-CoA reductase-like NAD-dependent aldehyde dehydrogenase